MPEQVALAWGHPDLGDGVAGMTVTARGRLTLVTGAAAIRQALLMVLSTVPGERVMRPDYGCDLGRLVFWPNDATTAGLAILSVRRAVERYEPRVEVLAVDADADPDRPGLLVVVLTYRIRATGQRDELALAVDLHGGL
jgi:hypothetical protein